MQPVDRGRKDDMYNDSREVSSERLGRGRRRSWNLQSNGDASIALTQSRSYSVPYDEPDNLQEVLEDYRQQLAELQRLLHSASTEESRSKIHEAVRVVEGKQRTAMSAAGGARADGFMGDLSPRLQEDAASSGGSIDRETVAAAVNGRVIAVGGRLVPAPLLIPAAGWQNPSNATARVPLALTEKLEATHAGAGAGGRPMSARWRNNGSFTMMVIPEENKQNKGMELVEEESDSGSLSPAAASRRREGMSRQILEAQRVVAEHRGELLQLPSAFIAGVGASCCDPKHPPHTVIDGRRDTFWATTGLLPQEVTLQLRHEVMRLNEVEVVCGGIGTLCLKAGGNFFPTPRNPPISQRIFMEPSQDGSSRCATQVFDLSVLGPVASNYVTLVAESSHNTIGFCLVQSVRITAVI